MKPRGWIGILHSALTNTLNNHTLAFSASLAYYFVLSLFPALIALAAVVGFLPIPNLLDQTIALMSRFIPPDSMGVVKHVVHDVLSARRGALLSFGLLGTLWSASSGFAGMIEALNVAYNVPETRPYWKTRGLAILLTIVIGGMLLVALTLMLLGPRFGGWLADMLHLSFLWVRAWPFIRWMVAGGFIVAALETTYLLGPNVKQRVEHTVVGTLFAVFGWLALSWALGIYFQSFANFNRTYGALGGIIALMVWLDYSSFVILLGAQINGAVLEASGNVTLKQMPRREVEARPKAA